MKIKTGILVLFLFIGLLGAPNCIFAQQYEDSTSDTSMQINPDSKMLLNGLTPLVKGGSGGGKSSGSSSSASKAVKKIDGDDDSVDGGDAAGLGWWTILIIVIVILGIIGVLVWYFVLRK